MSPYSPRPGRALAKSLVVTAIVAVLAGLVSAAVIKALEAGTRARVAAEIRQLDAACNAFKAHFGDFPPSRIRLRRDGDYDLRLDASGAPINKLDWLSHRALTQFWSQIKFPMNWNGNPSAPAGSVWELQGDQCLVFFLGGIPFRGSQTLGCLGFSTDPLNPAHPSGDRLPAFFEFHASRLRDLGGNGFWSYLDPYEGKPYAYFSSWNKNPGYADATCQGTGLYSTDCRRLGVWPYAHVVPNPPIHGRLWHRPASFQIISAGKDGRFGPGTDLTSAAPAYWTGHQPSVYTARFPDAADDLSNFHDLLLGVPSN